MPSRLAAFDLFCSHEFIFRRIKKRRACQINLVGTSPGLTGCITKSGVSEGNMRPSSATRLAPVQVFNAVPSTLFSVAAELATLSHLQSADSFLPFHSAPDLRGLRHPRHPQGRVPSKSISGGLNLQWSLRLVADDPDLCLTPLLVTEPGAR